MIVLAPDHLKRIADAAEAAWPAECCGLLVGAEGADGICRVACVVASRNRAVGAAGPAARDRFEVDPAVRLRLHLQLRGSDRRIVGLYHSHPGQPAQPSQRDLDAVLEPELIWLIVSVVSGQQLDDFSIFQADELNKLVTGMAVRYEGDSNVGVGLRGVGTFQQQSNPSRVGVYMDDFYMASQAAFALASMFDMASVQVDTA